MIANENKIQTIRAPISSKKQFKSQLSIKTDSTRSNSNFVLSPVTLKSPSTPKKGKTLKFEPIRLSVKSIKSLKNTAKTGAVKSVIELSKSFQKNGGKEKKIGKNKDV